MSNGKLKVVFVRRGYSPSGSAESYLTRLAQGIVDLGHQALLVTTVDWPVKEWPFESIVRLRSDSPIDFADDLEKLRPQISCDVLFSLERVWRCDVYRAGDGVHQAWLQRRAESSGLIRNLTQVLNRKHSAALALDESLLTKGGAGRVIANSKMVKEEILRFHRVPEGKIDVIYNGLPV